MAKASSWISATPSLLESVQLINGIDEKKFPLFLNRISQRLQNAEDVLCPFTKEEEDKLLVTLNGVETKNDLDTAFDASLYILLKAAYNVTNPPTLKNDLVELLKMNVVKAEIFSSTWASSAKRIVANLRQKSIHDLQLEGLSWMVNVSTASILTIEKPESRAIIELKLKQDDNNAGNIVLDMNQNQLYELFNTLEKIQSELDNYR